MNKFIFSKIKVGKKETIILKTTETNLKKFTSLSRDTSLIHTNDKYAKKNGFKKKIFQGAYLVSQFSRIIGTKLPGKYGLLLLMDIKFIKPLYTNELLIITAKVIKKQNALKCITLNINAKVRGEEIANANATIKLFK